MASQGWSIQQVPKERCKLEQKKIFHKFVSLKNF